LPASERFLIDSVCIEVGFDDQCPLSALRDKVAVTLDIEALKSA
jgi:hypothetical protein